MRLGETLEILGLVLVYSIAVFFSGMQLEKASLNKKLPHQLRAAFIHGAKMGIDFGVAQEKRDELQGVRCEPEEIK